MKSKKVVPTVVRIPLKSATRPLAGDFAETVIRATGTVRLIFPAPVELAARIDEEWHRRRLRSRAETIRVLLEEALKP